MDERLYQIKKDFPDAILHFIKAGIMPMSFVRIHEKKKLLDIWEQLGFGPNIAAHCAWNLRVKLPQLPEAEGRIFFFQHSSLKFHCVRLG